MACEHCAKGADFFEFFESWLILQNWCTIKLVIVIRRFNAYSKNSCKRSQTALRSCLFAVGYTCSFATKF